MNAEPGFLQEVLTALTQFPDCDRDANLVIDAMSIKKGKVYDRVSGKFVGLVDFGNESMNTSVEATEALYFMLVCLNGKWKLPIAYFLINKITAKIQGELINAALELTHKKAVRVRSITFDGASTNLATARYLAKTNAADDYDEDYLFENIDLDVLDENDGLHDGLYEINALEECEEGRAVNQFPHFFLHPKTKEKIYIILDPSHMIKLARNALGNEI